MRRRRLAGKILIVMLSVMLVVTYMPVTGVYAAGKATDVQKMLNKMSTREKIMQCMMLDFRKWDDGGGEAVNMTVLHPDVAELLEEYQPGSVILFAENIKETAETVTLTKDMQQAVMDGGGLPLLFTTDQEGGNVFRLGSGTALSGNMALAATGDPGNAEIAGSIIGRELESVGINTTLAPVVDVNNNANNPVIGIRSFSDDPYMVSTYGNRYIAGLNQYNVIGCAKHFPGHGDTSTDSHYGLPEVDKSLYQLSQCELIPFKAVIDQGIEMIMTAHILYPQVDDTTILSEKTQKEESRPATMSEKILTGLLRNDMGFEGVVVTDAMNMKGVAANFTMEQATLEALKAGADMVCMPLTEVYDKAEWKTRMERIIDRVEQAAKDDTQFAARLDEAVTRILTLKKNKGILDYDPDHYTIERALATVGSKENRSLEREIAAEGVTVIRNESKTLPLKPDKDSHILLLAPYDNEKGEMLMGVNRAKAAGLIAEDTKVWADVFSPEKYRITGEIEKDLEWADIVIINSEVASSGMGYGDWTSIAPKLYTEYCKLHGKKSIVMSVRSPYDVQMYPDADAILAVYGCKGTNISGMAQLTYGEITEDTQACGPNIAAGVEVIFGVFGASGKLPVNIPVFDPQTGDFTDEIKYERGYGLTYGKVQPPQPQPPKVIIKKASIKSLKAGKRKMTVTMTTRPAKKGGTHYQIAYKVKGSKKWKNRSTKSAKLRIKGLKYKTYVVKARAYKTVDGKKHYGAWSKKKTVKVK